MWISACEPSPTFLPRWRLSLLEKLPSTANRALPQSALDVGSGPVPELKSVARSLHSDAHSSRRQEDWYLEKSNLRSFCFSELPICDSFPDQAADDGVIGTGGIAHWRRFNAKDFPLLLIGFDTKIAHFLLLRPSLGPGEVKSFGANPALVLRLINIQKECALTNPILARIENGAIRRRGWIERVCSVLPNGLRGLGRPARRHTRRGARRGRRIDAGV